MKHFSQHHWFIPHPKCTNNISFYIHKCEFPYCFEGSKSHNSDILRPRCMTIFKSSMLLDYQNKVVSPRVFFSSIHSLAFIKAVRSKHLLLFQAMNSLLSTETYTVGLWLGLLIFNSNDPNCDIQVPPLVQCISFPCCSHTCKKLRTPVSPVLSASSPKTFHQMEMISDALK